MILAIANQKGGTGKTTTAINVSCCLAEQGKKVLLLGMDVQGDLSYALGITEFEKTISDVLLDDINIQDITFSKEGVDIVPSDVSLADVELSMSGVDKNAFFLKERLEKVTGKYDYIIIDCSPSLSILTVNALTAANQIIIPLQLTVLGVNGLELMISTIEKVKKVLNKDLAIMGVLPVMVDNRKKLTKEIAEYLQTEFKLRIFKTSIRSNVKAAESPSFGQSVIKYAPTSASAMDYRSLTEEILKIK